LTYCEEAVTYQPPLSQDGCAYIQEGFVLFNQFDACLLAILALAVVIGVGSIWWVRWVKHGTGSVWGHGLFLFSLVVVGTGSIVALVCAARCLVPFGLSAGWLVIGMLWEDPFPSRREG
jgi:hypothetical protein